MRRPRPRTLRRATRVEVAAAVTAAGTRVAIGGTTPTRGLRGGGRG